MKGYKLSKEHDKHFELIHPDGGGFKVAKSGLSEAHMKKIRKMADGGLVEGGSSEEDTQANPFGKYAGVFEASAAQNPVEASRPLNDTPLSRALNGQAGADVAAPPVYAYGQTPGDVTTEATPKTQETPKTPKENPNTMMPQGGMHQASYNATGNPVSSSVDALQGLRQEDQKIVDAQIKAYQKSADAAQAAANQQAQIYADSVQKMQAQEADSQKRHAALDLEQGQLKQDIADTKIDPTRLWSNASTGNKVLAGIGVLLSGIGSGLAGGPNLALSVIQKAIDADVDAQKANLGKKENLLTQNYKKYGDLAAAEAATRAQLASTVQAQIASTAAKASGPQAQAVAKAAIGQLQLHVNDNNRQVVLKGVSNDIINSGGSPNLTYSQANEIAKGSGLGVVNTPAGVKFAKTPEDAKKLSELNTVSQSVDKQIGNMMSFASKTGTTLPGTTNNTLAKGLKTQLMLDLKTIDELGVLSKGDLELMQDLVPNPGAVMTDKAIAQLAQLRTIYRDKVQQAYANRLVNPSGLGPAPTASQDVPVGAQLTNWKP